MKSLPSSLTTFLWLLFVSVFAFSYITAHSTPLVVENKTVGQLELRKSVKTALMLNGVLTSDQLRKRLDREPNVLRTIPGVGMRGLIEIREAIQNPSAPVMGDALEDSLSANSTDKNLPNPSTDAQLTERTISKKAHKVYFVFRISAGRARSKCRFC